MLELPQDGQQVRAIGLMSGTSADGIDAALVQIDGQGAGLRLQVHAHVHLPYSARVRTRILRAAEARSGTVDEVCRLHGLLGELFSRAAQTVADDAGIPLEKVDVIGSHGQTLHHLPRMEEISGVPVTSTLQVGSPAIIAERTGVTTVADFRARDMAAGGQGAPLVPYVDFLLFQHRARGRLVLNLGGIASVTALPAGCALEHVGAFDIGPAGMVSDRLVHRLTGGQFFHDPGGKYARNGAVSKPLLTTLLQHPYLALPPPKSCGREEFGEAFVADLLQHDVKPIDLIATLTRFSAAAVAQAYERFLSPTGKYEEMILSGGNVRNPVLVESLQELLPRLSVVPSDDYGLPAQAKEAVSFAVLASETIRGQPGNLPSATGARHRVVLGSIVPGRSS